MMRALIILLLSLLATYAAPARAQGDDDLRSKARELAAAGGEQFQNGEYAEALVKLDEAYRILRVPTLGFYSGQCLEKLGRWVEAAARYQEVTNLALPERKRELHAGAREGAAKARAALLPRIPRLSVELAVDGERKAPLVITIDERPIAETTLGAPMPIDPGEHVVAAAIGQNRVSETVNVEEGKDAVVSLKLVIEPEPIVVLPPPPPPPPTEPTGPTPVDNSGIRTAGYVVLGISGAVIIGGIVTGAILLGEKSSLDEVCNDDAQCSGAADVGTYNAMRPTTTVLLSVGAAGAAIGLVLALAFPDEHMEASWTPVLGPGYFGVRSAF